MHKVSRILLKSVKNFRVTFACFDSDPRCGINF